MTSQATDRMAEIANTDREIWREREGDYYADSIHVTKEGAIGINCGGNVIVLPIREWHKRADTIERLEAYVKYLEETLEDHERGGVAVTRSRTALEQSKAPEPPK